MPDQKFDQWLAGISSTRAKREHTWAEICAHAAELGRDQLTELLRKIERENRTATVEERLTELHSQINQIIRLLAAQPWHREPHTTFSEWFFGPFRPRSGGPRVSTPCAVVGVCDQEHIRDVQAQIILGRHLSASSFPDTKFYHVPLQDPDWTDVGLDKINAFCVIGRPTMLARCPVIEKLDEQLKKRLHRKRFDKRFALPPDDKLWRSRRVDKETAASFHHVVQRPALPGTEPYCVVDKDGRRTDYAIIQRFVIDYDNRPMTVVILAGATSLGTVGAVEWVTNGEMAAKLEEVCARFGKTLDEETEMEALLKVTAEVRSPARPWVTIGREPIKLFLDDSVNTVAPPLARMQITLVTRNGVPDVLMLNDDEVRSRGKDYTALVAVCKAACRQASNRVGAGSRRLARTSGR